MSEEEDQKPAEGAEGEVQPAAGKSKKKIILIAAVLLLAVAGGGGYYFLKMNKPHDESAAQLDEHGNPITQSVFYTLPEFLVNLNSGTKQSVFLKTTVILELSSQSDVARIESNLPRLQDGINTYLRELRSSDLAGSAGIQRLREEIMLRVNKAISPVQVTDVLFKEIVVQ
jgi:flagellar protein FliL